MARGSAADACAESRAGRPTIWKLPQSDSPLSGNMVVAAASRMPTINRSLSL
jgi:hypothetical protein